MNHRELNVHYQKMKGGVKINTSVIFITSKMVDARFSFIVDLWETGTVSELSKNVKKNVSINVMKQSF